MFTRSRIGALLVLSGACVLNANAQDARRGLIQYPSISPDASYIVFSAAGDLWSVPVEGGAAERLTVHPGIENQSRFSHDGDMIVFESNRDGAQNLYTMELREHDGRLVAGEIERVTTSDRSQQLGGFDAEEQRVLFSAYMYREIYRHPRMYGAALDGGPIERVTDAFGRGPATHAGTEDIYFYRGYYYPHRVAYRGPGNTDIWRFTPSDGTFEQLTHFDGNDFEPNILPDGSMVYLSSRDGQYNLVRLEAGKSDQDPGAVRQITHFKPNEDNPTTIAHGVRDLQISADGSTAVFVVWNTLYTLDLTDPRAKPVGVDIDLGDDTPRDRFERDNISREVSEAAVHPSGKAIAQISRGELFVRSTDENHPTVRVTYTAFRERDIAWSPDGVKLYFAADDEESLGKIYAATVSLSRGDLRPEPEPDEVSDEPDDAEPVGDEQAAEDTDEGDAEPQDGGAGEEPEENEAETDDAKDDENKEPKVDYAKRWSEALRFDIEVVVEADAMVYSPVPSPDGTKLLYIRERGDIFIRDLRTGEDRMVMELWSEPDVQWASDSRHLVAAVTDLDFNSDIWLVDTHPGENGILPDPINITQHPDIDHSPQLSHDGKVLTFLSDRDNENWAFDVYAVYLDRVLEGMAGYELDQYFKDATETAEKRKPLKPVDLAVAPEPDAERDTREPLTFDADDAYLRIRRLTSTPESESGLVMTPGGDRVMFSTVIDGDRHYVSVDHRGRDRKTIKSGGAGDPRVSHDGKTLSYVSGGQAATTTPTGGKTNALPIDATITIDRRAELAQKFHEAAGLFGMYFYHPTLKGRDWDALTERYRELVMQTRTQEAFLRLMDLMWGEVDGSHTGTRGGDGYSAGSPGNGYLGIDFTPVGNGYRIDAIIKGGPIDQMENGPQIGDVIVAIGDQHLAVAGGASSLRSLHESMAHLAREEVLLEYVPADSVDGATKLGLVTPTTYGGESALRYDDEVEKRRAEVDRLSGGRLGYLHIRGMGINEVRNYERDLYAAAHGKDGLIIDVRDNGGGWTTDILLASLTAPNHAYTIPRGADPDAVQKDNYPRDRRLIYAYSRPINVLINQNSFSNAEIFAHSIRTSGRGTLIGTQTFGGVISTGSFSLIDGTTIRRPFRGWYLPDGTDMESNGAKPDIDVPQLPADEAAGRDPQLEAAVSELLGRIEN